MIRCANGVGFISNGNHIPYKGNTKPLTLPRAIQSDAFSKVTKSFSAQVFPGVGNLGLVQ